MRVRLVGGGAQRMRVDGSLLTFLEIGGDRRGDVIEVDPLKMLYIAYESIRCSELLDELSVLEARICSKVLASNIDEVREALSIFEKSAKALTEREAALDEQLLPEVEVKDSPQEVLVRVTRTDFEVAGIDEAHLVKFHDLGQEPPRER